MLNLIHKDHIYRLYPQKLFSNKLLFTLQENKHVKNWILQTPRKLQQKVNSPILDWKVGKPISSSRSKFRGQCQLEKASIAICPNCYHSTQSEPQISTHKMSIATPSKYFPSLEFSDLKFKLYIQCNVYVLNVRASLWPLKLIKL